MYITLINEIDPDINGAGVIASMRLQYGTLDHLDHTTFVQETALARACEANEPGFLQRVAASYGLEHEYTAEEQRLDERRGSPARSDEDGR